MALTDSQKKARDKYNAKAYRPFVVRVNKILEPELIEYLESKKSTQGFILDLIRREKNNEEK